MLKLNLGCGEDIKPKDEGWINIDARELNGVDLVLDLEEENLPYAPNSVDYVNMQDILEHIKQMRHESLFRNIFDILKLSGKLYVQIPDLEVLAKRYLNVLENPTELQHPLDAHQLAACLYGGQDYLLNIHKWGYDRRTLAKMLMDIGFAVSSAHSDGGSNLLCLASKPPKEVYISASGGLGDVIQCYLSDPIDPEGSCYKDDFASSDPTMSLWYRRIENLNAKYPNTKVFLAIGSHNKYAKELFKYHPCIDHVVDIEYGVKPMGDMLDERFGKGACIHRVFNYKLFEPSVPKIYMSQEEEDTVSRITSARKYIVMNPFARIPLRTVPSISKYMEIASALVSAGYGVVIVGTTDDPCGIFNTLDTSVVNLVNVSSVRVSTALVLSASGFVGTHSAMILPAWYAKVRSVCFAPPVHDGGQPWEEFFGSNNPTTCGADKPFNKTVIVEKDKDVDIDEVVRFIKGGL